MNTRYEVFYNFIEGLEKFVCQYIEEYGFFANKKQENNKKIITVFDGYETEIKIKTKLQQESECNHHAEGEDRVHEYIIDFHLYTEVKILSNDKEELECILHDLKFYTGMNL